MLASQQFGSCQLATTPFKLGEKSASENSEIGVHYMDLRRARGGVWMCRACLTCASSNSKLYRSDCPSLKGSRLVPSCM